MRTTTAILLVAQLALLPASALAQSQASDSIANGWTGKSVALARVNGRAMSAACPKLVQIDHFVRERARKWDDASIGCQFMLSGNFIGAKVVEQSGDYIRVTFALAGFPTTRTLWTPRGNFRLVS